jgi:predicted RNA-binding protein
MCEFTVFLDKSIVFRDVVYVKLEGAKLLLKDILGTSKTVENCKIVEVDVHSQRLVLSSS